MNKLLSIVPLAACVWSVGAFALDWELERELNDLELAVEVLDVELDDEGLHLEAGTIAVMVTNHELAEVRCQLMPGPTEYDPGMEASPVHILQPGARGVLRMAGVFGDETLHALLTCQLEDEEDELYD